MKRDTGESGCERACVRMSEREREREREEKVPKCTKRSRGSIL